MLVIGGKTGDPLPSLVEQGQFLLQDGEGVVGKFWVDAVDVTVDQLPETLASWPGQALVDETAFDPEEQAADNIVGGNVGDMTTEQA